MPLDFHLPGVPTPQWWFLSDTTKYEGQHPKNVLGAKTYNGQVPTTHGCLQIKKIKGYINTKVPTLHGWLQNDKYKTLNVYRPRFLEPNHSSAKMSVKKKNNL